MREVDPERRYFVANLDTFAGNSGSPVFNPSYEVVGVLSRGAADYDARPGANCNDALVCPVNGCLGETVTLNAAFEGKIGQ